MARSSQLFYSPELGSGIQIAFQERYLAGASSQSVLKKCLGSSLGPKLCQDLPNNKDSRSPVPVTWQCLSAQTEPQAASQSAPPDVYPQHHVSKAEGWIPIKSLSL